MKIWAISFTPSGGTTKSAVNKDEWDTNKGTPFSKDEWNTKEDSGCTYCGMPNSKSLAVIYIKQ